MPADRQPSGLTARLAQLSAVPWVLVLLAAALLLRLPIFFYPFFNGDEATYAALANALLDGHLLYVGAVDHKPPGIAASYALILGLFGRFQLDAVHLVAILVVAATAGLLGRVARRLGLGRGPARAAALLYLAFSTVGPGKDMLAANAELFMLLPTVAAACVFLRGRAARGPGAYALLLVVAGALSGLAFLYKYQGGAILGTLVLFVLLDRGRAGLPRLRDTALLGVGFLVPALLVLAVYAAAGELSSLYFWAWSYPLRYAGKLGASAVLANALVQTACWAVPCLALLVAAGVMLRRAAAGRIVSGQAGAALPCPVPPLPCPVPPLPAPAVRLSLLWLLGGLAGVTAGGRYFLHYYLQLLPPLCLLAAPLFCPEPEGQQHPWWSPARGRLLLGLAVLPVLLFWGANALDHTLRPRIPRYTAVYQAVGRWVQEHSTPEERLFVWGNSPEIYHFSARRMGTRFPFCNYHSGKIWGTPADEEGATGLAPQQVAEAWPLLLDDLERRRPELLVDAAAGGLDRWGGHELARYPRLWAIVTHDYRPAGQVAGVTIYRRK